MEADTSAEFTSGRRDLNPGPLKTHPAFVLNYNNLPVCNLALHTKPSS